MPSPKNPERYEGIERRIHFTAIAIVIAFSGLCVQLWQVQVVEWGRYEEEAKANSIGLQRLPASRGVIYGRGGVVLADNRASANVTFVPGECPEEQRNTVYSNLEELIGTPSDWLREQVDNCRSAPFTQITVKSDITKTERIAVEEHSFALPGVVTVVHPQRRYIYGQTGGQVLGYVGEINKEELRDWDGYQIFDLVGRSGLEQIYEFQLHGQYGYTFVTKYASGLAQLRTDRRGVPIVPARDNVGHQLQEEGQRQEPSPGNPLNVTLDIVLQAKCEELLAAERGAAVVLDADTGAVLALASTPGYDPNIFVNRGYSDIRLELIESERMFNRCIQENYPPGSVFKIAMAAAALEEGVIDKQSHYNCNRYFQLSPNSRQWKCHSRWGHGAMDVVHALAYSCDVFFYNVGVELGIDRIAQYARAMGIGTKTGIDLPGEVQGLMPDTAWKDALNKGKPPWERRWYPGETVNASIGQGSVAATPLQCAVLMACVVNGGYRVQPFLNADSAPVRSERLFSETTRDIIVEGLRMCVAKREGNPQGTGRRAYIEGMDLIGKTGTAQVVRLQEYENEEDIPYKLRDHAWFVAGVLDRQPRIAVCVLVEHGPPWRRNHLAHSEGNDRMLLRQRSPHETTLPLRAK